MQIQFRDGIREQNLKPLVYTPNAVKPSDKTEAQNLEVLVTEMFLN